MALDVEPAAESAVVFFYVEVGVAIGMILLVDRDKDFFVWEFVRLQVLQDVTEADEFGCHGWLLDVVVQSEVRETSCVCDNLARGAPLVW